MPASTPRRHYSFYPSFFDPRFLNQPETCPNWDRRGLVLAEVSTSLANDSTLISYVNQNKQNPTDYLMSKLRDNDVILLGERHNQGHQLEMVNSFIQRLSKVHPSTILALEISTDEQNRVDYFLETGTGLEEIKFSSHLSSTLYKDLLITARESGKRYFDTRIENERKSVMKKSRERRV